MNITYVKCDVCGKWRVESNDPVLNQMWSYDVCWFCAIAYSIDPVGELQNT